MSGRALPRIPGVIWIGAGVGSVGALAIIASGGGPSIPAVFIALAIGMLLFALSALYQSLRAAFSDATFDVGLRTRLPERAALLDEKDALLRAIKDIAFEHEVGKLADDDFARLDRAYRTRAKEVLQKLDADLAPYLDRAERLLNDDLGPAVGEEPYRSAGVKRGKKKAARRDCPACGTSNALNATWCKECGAAMVTAACGACGAENEADAKFCIACAAPLGAGGAAKKTDAAPGAREAKKTDAAPGASEAANETGAGEASEESDAEGEGRGDDPS